MADLRRLSQGGLSDEGSSPDASALAQHLLASARKEEPRNVALQRTLAAVGVGSAALGAAASASALSSATSNGALATGATTAGTAGVGAGAAGVGAAGLGAGAAGVGTGIGGGALGAASAGVAGKALLIKWLGVVVVGGAAAAGTGKLLQPSQVAAPTAVVQEAASNDVPAPVALPKPAPPTTNVVPTVVDAPPTPALEREPIRADDDTPPTPSQLAKEVLLIDRAREALAAQDHARALNLVRQYQARFPSGRLLPEAAFLQMEAERGLGRGQAAQGSARKLLELAPHSPQAERARELLQGEQ